MDEGLGSSRALSHHVHHLLYEDLALKYKFVLLTQTRAFKHN
jgi:hypothetical protein